MATSALDQARSHYRDGRFAESAQIYEQLLARGEAPAEALYGLGLIRIAERRDDEARTVLERALDYERAPNTLYYLGEIAERAGDRTRAIACYGEALARQPAHAGALARVARLAGPADATPLGPPAPGPQSGPPPAVAAPRPVAPPPVAASAGIAPPRPAHATAPPEAPPREPSPGATVGRVGAVQREMAPWRGKPAAQAVWRFRIQVWQPAPGQPSVAAVEMRGNEIKGWLSEGDWVEIEDSPRDGGFRPKELSNLTTGERVKSKRYWLTSS
jgi:hypothetical protein